MQFNLAKCLQFSTRRLFAAMTAGSLPLGYATHGARRQASAVDAITNSGGTVTYQFEEDEIDKPAWLIRLIDIDYFSQVDSVVVGNMNLVDHLASFKAAES